jgi:hypothetical protein
MVAWPERSPHGRRAVFRRLAQRAPAFQQLAIASDPRCAPTAQSRGFFRRRWPGTGTAQIAQGRRLDRRAGGRDRGDCIRGDRRCACSGDGDGGQRQPRPRDCRSRFGTADVHRGSEALMAVMLEQLMIPASWRSEACGCRQAMRHCRGVRSLRGAVSKLLRKGLMSIPPRRTKRAYTVRHSGRQRLPISSATRR